MRTPRIRAVVGSARRSVPGGERSAMALRPRPAVSASPHDARRLPTGAPCVSQSQRCARPAGAAGAGVGGAAAPWAAGGLCPPVGSGLLKEAQMERMVRRPLRVPLKTRNKER